MPMEGLIIKGIGGFYYVDTGSEIIEAKGRGIFKKGHGGHAPAYSKKISA